MKILVNADYYPEIDVFHISILQSDMRVMFYLPARQAFEKNVTMERIKEWARHADEETLTELTGKLKDQILNSISLSNVLGAVEN